MKTLSSVIFVMAIAISSYVAVDHVPCKDGSVIFVKNGATLECFNMKETIDSLKGFDKSGGLEYVSNTNGNTLTFVALEEKAKDDALECGLDGVNRCSVIMLGVNGDQKNGKNGFKVALADWAGVADDAAQATLTEDEANDRAVGGQLVKKVVL